MDEQSVEEKEKEDYDDTRKELDKVYDLAWTKIFIVLHKSLEEHPYLFKMIFKKKN